MRAIPILLVIALSSLTLSCSRKPVFPGLVSTSVMGVLRGNHFVRAITHFHSPYSFDACDGKGYHADGTIDLNCLRDAKYAFCENHINFVFFSDHVEHMAETDYQKLLLAEEGDTGIQNGSGDTIATQIHCPDGFGPVMAPGLEGQLLGLGMEKHISTDVEVRKQVYGGNTTAEKTTLQTDANALVAVPHTESKETADLIALQPDVIEIYNLHANLDPKIRKKYLNKKPFALIAKFLNYLVDPYNSLFADTMFMDFLEYSPVYFEKWNALLAAGLHVTGVGGLDSHENIFSQKASDGQRLDHHRRMTRFFNNLVLTPTNDLADIKSSIRAGRVFFVVEGMGVPTGLDYHGTLNNTSTVEMGADLSIGTSDTASLVFQVPSVHAKFIGMDGNEKPEIRAELHRIDASAQETVVARASGASTILTYPDPAAGHYRVHVFMKAHHLRKYLFNQNHADEDIQWIISNPIKVVR